MVVRKDAKGVAEAIYNSKQTTIGRIEQIFCLKSANSEDNRCVIETNKGIALANKYS